MTMTTISLPPDLARLFAQCRAARACSVRLQARAQALRLDNHRVRDFANNQGQANLLLRFLVETRVAKLLSAPVPVPVSGAEPAPAATVQPLPARLRRLARAGGA